MIHYSFLLLMVAILTFSSVALHAEEMGQDECGSLYLAQKSRAFDLCMQFAEQDHAKAQKYLADMYYWGWQDKVKEPDYKQALLWYKRAARGGDVTAKYVLGVMYEQGKGTDINYERSSQWFYSAAEDGHRDAQYNLGNMFSKGSGVKRNRQLAVKWYTRAAEQGNVDAMYNLGNAYGRGLGVKQDLRLAYIWFARAVKLGDEGSIESRDATEVFVREMSIAGLTSAKEEVESWKPVLELPEETYQGIQTAAE